MHYFEGVLKNIFIKTWKTTLICIVFFTLVEEYSDLLRSYQQSTRHDFMKEYSDYCNRNLYSLNYNSHTNSLLELCSCIPDGLGWFSKFDLFEL